MSKHKTRQINRIISATLGLIDDDGLSGLSISNIADAAGVTRQTIYNYFPDVESIISQALEAHSNAMMEHQIGLLSSHEGVENKLFALAEFHISNASAEHGSVPLEAGLSAQGRRALTERKDTVVAEIARALTSKTPQSEVMAAQLWAMIESSTEVASAYPDQKQYLLELLFKAMQATIRD